MMKEHKWVWLLLATAVIMVAAAKGVVTAYADEPATAAAWQASYWNNTTLSGSPVLQRSEMTLMNDWGSKSPAEGIVEGDHFSARWTRTLALSPGQYRFMATADDGIRVWVNDELIIDGWQDQARTVYIGYATTDGSPLDVRVEYYDRQHDAVAQLTWKKVSGSGPLLLSSGEVAANSNVSIYEPVVSNWYGEYFSNAFLIGEPVLIRDDTQIDFDWGLNTPDDQYEGLKNERFSARWTKTVDYEPGTYRFAVTVDDGVRVWVDGKLIIDQWDHHAGATFTADVELSGGEVPIRVEYFDDVGNAEIHFSWERLTDNGQQITEN